MVPAREEAGPLRSILPAMKPKCSMRAGDAHIGIAADRLTVGLKMESQMHPGIFLLDDGFGSTSA